MRFWVITLINFVTVNFLYPGSSGSDQLGFDPSDFFFKYGTNRSLSFLTGKLYCQYPLWISYNPLSCFSIQMILRMIRGKSV